MATARTLLLRADIVHDIGLISLIVTAVGVAGSLLIWRAITLPSLRPTFVFLILTGSFDAMSRFGDLWTLGVGTNPTHRSFDGTTAGTQSGATEPTP